MCTITAGYATIPHLLAKIDTPPRLRCEARVSEGVTAHLGVQGDCAEFLAHDPLDEAGYGGRTFVVPMLDESAKEVKGPWSSNSMWINSIFYDKAIVIEATVDWSHGKEWWHGKAVTLKGVCNWLARQSTLPFGMCFYENNAGTYMLEPTMRLGTEYVLKPTRLSKPETVHAVLTAADHAQIFLDVVTLMYNQRYQAKGD